MPTGQYTGVKLLTSSRNFHKNI